MTITELTRYLIESHAFEMQRKRRPMTEEEVTKFLEKTLDAEGMVFMEGDPRAKELKKIVPVDEDVKKAILEQDKKEFIEGRGMGLGGYKTKVPDMIKSYVKTLRPEIRISTAYTLDQARIEQARSFRRRIRDVDPNWNYGDSFNPKILDIPMVDEYV